MDKLKAFFDNKIVKIVAWVVLALDVVTLILGGASVTDVSDGVQLIAGIIGAIAGFIIFISNRIKKEK